MCELKHMKMSIYNLKEENVCEKLQGSNRYVFNLLCVKLLKILKIVQVWIWLF